MTSTLSYNKEQLLNYYRASCPEIQEPPENLKQFPLILSTKLLQPVNETNLHLFDSDYNINPESTFPTLSTRGRGRGGRGGSRRGGGLSSSGRGSSISPLVTSSLGGSPSGTSSLFGSSPTSLGRAGTPIGSGPRAIARSPLSLGGSRLPAWAMDEDLTQTDSSLTGLNNNSNSLLSNNSFFGNSTSNSSLDDDTFGPGALQPQSSHTYQPMVSLESLAAATMKMNEHWKTQMGKKPLDDFDDSLEPQGLNDNDGAIEAIDWDSQWYYLSEDNEPKGPYNLQKLKEWMDLFYLQSETRIKQDIESHATTTLGEVLNSLTQQNNSHMNHGMGNNILASQHLLSNNGMKGNMHSNDFFMNDKPSIPTGSILGSPFMSQSLVKSPIQGSLLSSLDKPQQPTPITPTSQQFSHPWGFGQQPMEQMVHPGYPFVNPNMPNHFMPPFHQGPGHWGNMPNLAMNLGASNNSNSIPSVTDIENELLYVQPSIPQHPTHQEVFQHYTPIQPISNVQEQMVVEEQEPIDEEEDIDTEQVVETPVEEETQIPQKEETIAQETPKVDDKTSKKEKNKKKGAEAKPANTPSKKKQELPPVKEEPVFKSVPPTETVSFADPKKEEVKGWGVQPAVTTAPVQTLKQIMEQQKKEALKQSKETQQKKKEAAEQVIKVNTANPWGVANANVVAPSLKEIQEEEAKKKKQKAQKQQQSQNQASVVKNASSTWGGSALQFKAIPEKDVPSTSSSSTHFGAVTPTKTVETKSFQFQAIKPQTIPASTSSTSPKEEEEDQEEGVFWDYSPTPANAATNPVITTASEKKNSKKDKKKKATNEKPTTTTSQTTTSVNTPSNTAVEEDFPSISAKNNPFGQADVSQEFKDWFKKGLKKLNKSVDPSFMYFLLSLNSEKETIDYMSEYIGNSSAAQKFAQEFIANKSFENPNQGANKKKK